MIRKLLITMMVVASVVVLQAQSDFARGFSSGAGMAGNVSYSFGSPFHTLITADDFTVSEGVMHAQLIRVDMELEGRRNDPDVAPQVVKESTGFFRGYEGENISFDGTMLNVFPAGYYDSTSYEALHYNWNAQFNYDSVTTLVLDVKSLYEYFDTLYLDSTVLADYAYSGLHLDPAQHQPLHGGLNSYFFNLDGDANDTTYHYFVNLCGGLVKDGDGNDYPSVFVGYAPQRYCWTVRNMRNTHDSEGNEIPNMIYHSQQFPDEAENLERYGRLYTWYAAVGLPENSTEEPSVTQNGGFVTGICPKGWHIPNAENLGSLIVYEGSDLMSEQFWLRPGSNSTGFDARPAGEYSFHTDRFENLLGQTHYWSTVTESYTSRRVCSIHYGCNIVSEGNKDIRSGVSVRCVKNQIYDRNGNELND